MMQPFQFDLQATDSSSSARAGVLQTAHGPILTPIFMPVGTQATVKALSPLELRECDCDIILANTYHLHLRPSDPLIKDAGGLHRFEQWDRAILTDSGGFQVFSLRDISKISDDGVWFQSYLDGSRHFFSPERVMEIQANLGADIVMAFDECPHGKAEPGVIRDAVDRTLRWAARCAEVHQRVSGIHGYPQALFGIVQGGTIQELRKRCAQELVELELPGYAIGGLAVGESIASMYDTVAMTASMLPQGKPRYLMGVGLPENILNCIERGIDMFDCVLPTRNARNGSVFTHSGKLNIRNARHANDFTTPLDPDCDCYACKTFSRSYLRHLFMAGEILAIRMLTLHNVFYYMHLVRTARERIFDGSFASWKDEVITRLSSGEESLSGGDSYGVSA